MLKHQHEPADKLHFISIDAVAGLCVEIQCSSWTSTPPKKVIRAVLVLYMNYINTKFSIEFILGLKKKNQSGIVHHPQKRQVLSFLNLDIKDERQT
jgi:hypothetical protein